MSTIVVPSLDGEVWPTLGPLVCAFLEERCVHGPGDLKGSPFRLDAEGRALIYRGYEVFPRGHPRAGKRRFKRVAWSLRKGTAKTEKAAAIAFAELHPEGPVRCDGFKRQGSAWVPVGRPVIDPYIPLVAYTEEQTEDLAYAALYVMVTQGPDADLFDAGLERILRLDDRGRADGKAVALASSPDARDGARTTFQHFPGTFWPCWPATTRDATRPSGRSCWAMSSPRSNPVTNSGRDDDGSRRKGHHPASPSAAQTLCQRRRTAGPPEHRPGQESAGNFLLSSLPGIAPSIIGGPVCPVGPCVCPQWTGHTRGTGG